MCFLILKCGYQHVACKMSEKSSQHMRHAASRLGMHSTHHTSLFMPTLPFSFASNVVSYRNSGRQQTLTSSSNKYTTYISYDSSCTCSDGILLSDISLLNMPCCEDIIIYLENQTSIRNVTYCNKIKSHMHWGRSEARPNLVPFMMISVIPSLSLCAPYLVIPTRSVTH